MSNVLQLLSPEPAQDPPMAYGDDIRESGTAERPAMLALTRTVSAVSPRSCMSAKKLVMPAGSTNPWAMCSEPACRWVK